MGLFDRFKRDTPAAAPAAGQPSPAQQGDAAAPPPYVPPVAAPQPTAPQQVVPQQPSAPQSALVQLAAIVTRGNPQVAADMQLLAAGYPHFRAVHPAWCEGMGFDDFDTDVDRTRDMFIYWLAGEDTPFSFGATIDWREFRVEVLAQLADIESRLGAVFGLDEVPFGSETSTEADLALIARHMWGYGWALTVIDGDGDEYHLFVVPAVEFAQFAALGTQLGWVIRMAP